MVLWEYHIVDWCLKIDTACSKPDHKEDIFKHMADKDNSASAKGLHNKFSNTSLLILITVCATTVFTLITVGALVRVTGSGLGCPDWPLCYGKIIPPFDLHSLIEYFHRLLATLAGIFLIGTALFATFIRPSVNPVKNILWTTVLLIILAGGLGAATVFTELNPHFRTLHLITAQSIFALLLVGVIWVYHGSTKSRQPEPRIFFLATLGAVITIIAIISGSITVGQGAGTICPSWPLCNSSLVPDISLEWLHLSHRIIAGVSTLVGVGAGLIAWSQRSRSTSTGIAGAFLVVISLSQVIVGAANPLTGFSSILRISHLTLATAQWGNLVILATLVIPNSLNTNFKSVARDYFALTKPMIIVLLLITALGGLFLASNGVPPLLTTLIVLIGGSLGAGGANAINHYLDRDIDNKMSRTSNRPLPSNRIAPNHALYFGITLNVIAFTVLFYWVNLISAALVAGATIFYALVYTAWLKRTSIQNIVIGGAAGAVPPMVGWAAITGGLELPSLYLFGIVFFWTPPHFWALSLLMKDDYAKAGVPMLPVVYGEEATAKGILGHSIILITLTILFATTSVVGAIYAASALMLGTIFLLYAIRVFRATTRQNARRLYLYSLLYLALLFTAMMVDAAVTF
ncbi:MAG: protoheme IX farnesyltransferase [Chloroflexi bacterium]|nr:MAG: protoheme IX farnesyltransferase [Chloroflexota bacterium]